MPAQCAHYYIISTYAVARALCFQFALDEKEKHDARG